MADTATTCPTCGKAAGQSAGGGTAAAPAPATQAAGGLSENVACGLAYITIIPAILFLVLEPYNRNRNIKFHAFQCIGLTVAAIACSVIMVVPVLGWILGALGHLAVFVLWLIALIKAFSGGRFKVPVIGDFAEKQANA
jgi:uncharacterized membrane protein